MQGTGTDLTVFLSYWFNDILVVGAGNRYRTDLTVFLSYWFNDVLVVTVFYPLS